MSSTEKSKNFLIIRFSSFGDVLLTSHIPTAIKKKYPDSKIFFLVKKTFSVMLKDHPYIDEIVYFKSISEVLKTLKEISFEAIIDLQHNYKSIILSLKIRGNHRVSYNKQSIKRSFFLLFKFGLYNEAFKTVSERYAETLTKLSIPFDTELVFNAKTDISGFNLPERYICLAPGSAHFTKQWPVEYQIELIKKIKKNTSYEIVLIGGPQEIDTADKIIQETKCYNFVGKFNFIQSSECIKNSEFIICNDSSVMHLARVHKKNGLVFFGSTTKRFGFYPKNENLEVFENNSLHCRPCSHIGKKICPKKHFKCMMDLRPENAWEIIEQRLSHL